MEKVDGELLTSQWFSELSDFLESQGFVVDIAQTDAGFSLLVHPSDLDRIFDNITSNLVKYADPTQPVYLQSTLEKGFVVVTIENTVRTFENDLNSFGLGLNTCASLAVRQGGSFMHTNDGKRFKAILRLALAPDFS